MQYVPNPDGVLYLRAAELFTAGTWEQGYAIHPRPFYSLAIAGISSLSGLSASASAQIFNVTCSALSAVMFLLLVRALTGNNRRTLIYAAILISLHHGLTDWRTIIIRDHGFVLFALVTMYLSLRAVRQPSAACYGMMVLAGIVSVLFRVEGIVILGLALLFPQFAQNGLRLKLAGTLALVSAILVTLVLCVWLSKHNLANQFSAQELVANFQWIANRIQLHVRTLAGALSSFEQDNAGASYILLCLMFVVSAVFRAARLHVVGLAIYGLAAGTGRTNLVMARFTVWYSSGILLTLVFFVLLNFFLAHRYALLLSIVFNVPAAIAMADLHAKWRQSRSGRSIHRFVLPVILVVLIVDWATEIPQPTILNHLHDAAIWIRQHAPADAVIASNDLRILYYAGAELSTGTQSPANQEIGTPHPYWSSHDIIALETAANTDRQQEIQRNYRIQPLKIFENRRGRQVLIYDLRSRSHPDNPPAK